MLVQADGDALRAPVREEPLHVLVDLRRADDQLGAVADLLLALVTLRRGRPPAPSRREPCSRRGCSGMRRDPTPRPRRTPASARSSPAGSSCCGRRRRRCPRRPSRASSCRARRCPRRIRARAAAPWRGGTRSRGRACRRRRRRSAMSSASSSVAISGPAAPSPRALPAASPSPTVVEPSTHGPSSGCGNFACCSLSWIPYELPDCRCLISTLRAISSSRPAGIGEVDLQERVRVAVEHRRARRPPRAARCPRAS